MVGTAAAAAAPHQRCLLLALCVSLFGCDPAASRHHRTRPFKPLPAGTQAWSPDAFGDTEGRVRMSRPRIFYKTVGPSAAVLSDCFESVHSSPISNEVSKIKGVRNYMPEDLGEYYLALQMEQYPNKAASLEDAALVMINFLPTLSLAARDCLGKLNSTYRERRDSVRDWVVENQAALKAIPTVYACTSWICARHALDQNFTETMASVNASIVINEAGPKFLPHWGPRDAVRHGSYFARHKVHAYVVPYSAHHNIPRPPPTVEKTIQFLYIGSLRRTPVREKLCEVGAKEPDVVMHVHGWEKRESSCQNRTTAANAVANPFLGSNDYPKLTLAAKFCFVPLGDTPTSRRLFDAIIAGCLPIIISDDIDRSLPFSSAIPYNDFAFRIPEARWVEDPFAEVQKLREVGAEEIKRRREMMAKYAPSLDWLAGTNVLSRLIDEVLQGNRKVIPNLISCDASNPVGPFCQKMYPRRKKRGKSK